MRKKKDESPLSSPSLYRNKLNISTSRCKTHKSLFHSLSVCLSPCVMFQTHHNNHETQIPRERHQQQAITTGFHSNQELDRLKIMMSFTPYQFRQVGLGVFPSPFYTCRPERRCPDSRVFDVESNRQDKDREVNVQIIDQFRKVRLGVFLSPSPYYTPSHRIILLDPNDNIVVTPESMWTRIGRTKIERSTFRFCFDVVEFRICVYSLFCILVLKFCLCK
ncbi:uncharacterized protein LOC130751560 [Actinidia eriantha]|uniref:uncharacterized protein LOC130751560 n=1 Tax=Actinidia eriantha TaxID=165200 RepID=UPI00258B3240|nr:uncharacterized protein LOC130751560 [Actinidia eriantha]